MFSMSVVQPIRGQARGRALVVAGLALLLPLGNIACGNPAAPEPGVQLDYRSFQLGGFIRSYILIRHDAGGDHTRPLLLMYHGAGGDARDLVDNTDLASKALAAGMVVASLDAVPGYGGRWATNPVDLAIVDDVTFTRAVLDEVAAAVPLDRTRVFAVGYSRGGEFVYQLACRAPELVRAVAAVSATLLRTNLEWCDAPADGTPPVSVTMVLGTDDTIIPWDGGPTRLGAIETLEYWRERNGCPTSAVESSHPAKGGWEVALSRFAPCARGDIRLFRVDPLDHSWPSVAFDVEGTIIDAFVAVPAGTP